MATDLPQELTVAAQDAGMRLDKWLAAQCPRISRARIQALIAAGQVTRIAADTGATILEADHAVKPGERYTVRLPEPAPEAAAPEPQAGSLDIVYEDADIIVINKPAGLVVHPAAGHRDRTLVNILLAHCGPALAGVGGAGRPGIVHRLDKDTSGLIVAAKTGAAYEGLVPQFKRHDIERAYEAAVWGRPVPPAGEIAAPLGRHPRNRKKMTVSATGKAAVTRYRLKAAFADIASHLICRLETGRTHQIRVHLAHIGHPVLGDRLYGRARLSRYRALAAAGFDMTRMIHRQALHAGVLGFRHPTSGDHLHFQIPPPHDMTDLLAALAGISHAGGTGEE